MSVETLAPLPVSESGAGTTAQMRSADATIQDYLTEQPGGLSGISQTPEAEARLLSNPANLGEKILSSLEGLHRRSQEISEVQQEQTPETNPVSFSPEPGPADRLPPAGGAAVTSAGSSGAQDPGAMEPFHAMLGTIREMNDHYLEVRLVGNIASSSTGSVNTLLRGQ